MLVEREETASTNDDARALALDGAPAGTAVLARRQLHGRGRAGRTWASPEGGLYLSVVLRPDLPPAAMGALPLVLGAATVDALRADGFPVDLKWPNDVLLENRKVGGLLLERRTGPDGFVIAGIGLNVEAAPADAPDAAALADSGAPVPTRRALAERLVAAWMDVVARLERDGVAALLDDVRARCVTLGKDVVWEKGEGVAVDLADDGALVVMGMDGRRQRVVAGDVRVRQRL